jgi:CelD/BcsL family acetyltransferase involved in cellulose biosynthesis
MVGGRIAAVDMGAIWKNSYTLLAGGTHPEFPGIAKLINLHHMEWSCSQKFDTVDFLCGNFNWKERFHLTPRPLYELSLDRDAASYGRTHIHEPRVVCA